MSHNDNTFGDLLIEGMEEALAHSRGEGELKTHSVTVRMPDVRATREQMNMSRKEFAAAFGFTVGSVRNWEQGVRCPTRTARVLLTVIERSPDLVRDVLRTQ